MSKGPTSPSTHRQRWLTRLRRLALVSICTLCLYVASFGPACWMMTRYDAQAEPVRFRLFSKVYEPVSLAIIRSPMWARGAFLWYLELGAAADARFVRDWPEGIAWIKPGYTYTVLSIHPDDR